MLEDFDQRTNFDQNINTSYLSGKSFWCTVESQQQQHDLFPFPGVASHTGTLCASYLFWQQPQTKTVVPGTT